jgi:hypothetical protein
MLVESEVARWTPVLKPQEAELSPILGDGLMDQAAAV